MEIAIPINIPKSNTNTSNLTPHTVKPRIQGRGLKFKNSAQVYFRRLEGRRRRRDRSSLTS